MTPTARPRVSLCMIVRDEAAQLGRCLDSLAGVVDEMVIVDTGSVDATPQLAESYGARVLHRPWDGSFSAARNASLDAATGDWVLIVDADEALVDGDRLHHAIATAAPEVEGFVTPIVNFVGERDYEEAVTSPAVRLFRNRPEYRFSRALHEQILAAIQNTRPGAQVIWADVPLEHWGYLNGVVAGRDKVARNLALAREEVERYPDDAFSWYNLAQESFRCGQWGDALEAFSHAFPMLPDLTAGYAPALLKHMVICLINLGRPEQALEVLADALQAYEQFTDLHALAGHALCNLGRWEAGAEAYRQALAIGDVRSTLFLSDEGVGTYKAYWWLAICERQLGQFEACEEHLLASAAVLSQVRRYIAPPIDLLFHLYRELQRPLADAVARVRQTVDWTHPRWREVVACRLAEFGETQLVLDAVEGLESLKPDTELAVAAAYLRSGRPREALAHLERIPAGCPQRLGADWTAVTALAMADDVAGAQAWFTQRLATGSGDLELFYTSLLALWRGAVTAPPPLAAPPSLRLHFDSVLRTLVSARAMSLLSRSLPALAWLGYTDAEQAALLGRLYHHAQLTRPAAEALALAVEAGDQTLETWQLLGLLLLKLEQFADSERVLAHALELQAAAGPEPPQNPTRAGWLAARAALAAAAEGAGAR